MDDGATPTEDNPGAKPRPRPREPGGGLVTVVPEDFREEKRPLLGWVASFSQRNRL